MKLAIKTFLSKYKSKILWMIILGYLIFFFTPTQNEFYLEQDIQFFKRNFYWKFALVASGIFLLVILIFGVLKKWKRKEFFAALLNVCLQCFILFILLKMVVIAIFLFTNRMIPVENYTTTYKIENASDSHIKMNNIHNAEDYIRVRHSENIFKQLSVDNLKEGDTITLKFQKGIWGIPHY
jgi:hypothetical protein